MYKIIYRRVYFTGTYLKCLFYTILNLYIFIQVPTLNTFSIIFIITIQMIGLNCVRLIYENIAFFFLSHWSKLYNIIIISYSEYFIEHDAILQRATRVGIYYILYTNIMDFTLDTISAVKQLLEYYNIIYRVFRGYSGKMLAINLSCFPF